MVVMPLCPVAVGFNHTQRLLRIVDVFEWHMGGLCRDGVLFFPHLSVVLFVNADLSLYLLHHIQKPFMLESVP